MPVVRIPDELFARLQRHATPLVDSVGDVLEKILTEYELRRIVPAVREAPLSTSVAVELAGDYPALWGAVANQFNALSPRYPVRSGGVRASFRKVLIGNPEVHYEWALRKRERYLDVCLHFESTSRTTNLERIAPIIAKAGELNEGIDAPFDAAPWGGKWAQARYRIRLEGNWPNAREIAIAAELMNDLIERTYTYAEN